MSTPTILQLRDFPNIVKAFREIEFDGGAPCNLRPRATVPAKWVTRFRSCERTLAMLRGLTLRDVTPQIHKRKYYDDLKDQMDLEQGAWLFTVIPINDSDELILQAAGASKTAIKAVKDVLNEFFDGDLHSVFAMPRKRVAYMYK